VGADVPVTEPEPLGMHAVGDELFAHRARLVGASPALLLVDPAPQGVHHRVQIGTDPEPEKSDVVSSVPDDRDRGRGFPLFSTVVQGIFEAAEKTCATDAASQYDYPH